MYHFICAVQAIFISWLWIVDEFGLYTYFISKHGTIGILLLKAATVKIWSYPYNKEYGQLKGAMKLN